MYSIGFKLALIAIMLAGCSAGDQTVNGGGTPEPQFSERAWIDEQELALNPNLHAQHHQTVVLELKDTPANNGLALVEETVHRLRYYLAKQTMIGYALDAQNPCIKGIVIDDGTGRRLIAINRETPAVQMLLNSGRYVMTVTEVSPLPQHCSKVFIYSPQAAVTTPAKISALSAAPPGDFTDNVLRLFGSVDQYGQGHYYATDNPGANVQYVHNGPQLQTNGLILKRFDRNCWDDNCSVNLNTQTDKMFTLSRDQNSSSWILKNGNGKAFGCYVYGPGVSTYQYMFDASQSSGAIFGFIPSSPVDQSSGCYIKDFGRQIYYPFSFDLTPGGTVHDFMFRISRLFCGDNYNNSCPRSVKGFIVNLQAAGATDRDNDGYIGGVNGTIQTHQDGLFPLHEVIRWHVDSANLPQTPQAGEVILYALPHYKGQALVLNTDTDYSKFPLVLNSFTVGSVKLAHDTTTITFGKSTTIGINTDDTSEMGLLLNSPESPYRANFSVFAAIKVVISNSCPDCNLEGADLSGLALDNRDFSGTNFIDARLNNASLQKSNLKGAYLQGANLNYANLKGANLCRALLNASPNTSRSTSLSGAYLSGANLAYTQMIGAQMDHISFHNPFANTCAPDENCNLNQMCSSAYKATLTGADFTGAYIPGLDLSGANLQQTTFSNAFALGTNFTGASLSNTTSGVLSRFNQTVLLGALFDNASVQGVTFFGAFVDDPTNPPPASKNAVVLLSSLYTGASGSKHSGTQVCTEYALKANTSLPPTTDATVICPDGSSGPCNGAQWLPMVPISSLNGILLLTSPPATPVAPAACAGVIDFLW